MSNSDRGASSGTLGFSWHHYVVAGVFLVLPVAVAIALVLQYDGVVPTNSYRMIGSWILFVCSIGLCIITMLVIKRLRSLRRSLVSDDMQDRESAQRILSERHEALASLQSSPQRNLYMAIIGTVISVGSLTSIIIQWTRDGAINLWALAITVLLVIVTVYKWVTYVRLRSRTRHSGGSNAAR